MEIQETLQRAEILFYQFKQRAHALDDKREKQQLKQRSTSTSQPTAMIPNLSPLLRDLLPQ
jgi:hypothetical protein